MNAAIRTAIRSVRKRHGTEVAEPLELACVRATRLATLFDDFSGRQGRLRDAAESLENLEQAVKLAARSVTAINAYLGPSQGLDLDFLACRRLPTLLAQLTQCAHEARSELGGGKRAGGRPPNTKAFAVAWQLAHALRPTLTARSAGPIVRRIMTAMGFGLAEIDGALRALRKHAGWGTTG